MTKKKIKIIDQSSHHIIFWGNELWFKHLDLKKKIMILKLIGCDFAPYGGKSFSVGVLYVLGSSFHHFLMKLIHREIL